MKCCYSSYSLTRLETFDETYGSNVDDERIEFPFLKHKMNYLSSLKQDEYYYYNLYHAVTSSKCERKVMNHYYCLLQKERIQDISCHKQHGRP